MTHASAYRPRSGLVFLLLLSLHSANSWSQQRGAPGPKQDPYRVGVEVNLVTVPVTVRKLGEGFVKAIPRSAFQIFEDGVRQEIVTFAQEGPPLQVALVLDVSGSVRPDWAATRYATKRFVGNLRPDDQLALVTFNSQTRLHMDWGRGVRQVDSILATIRCNGGTSVWDAIWVVCTDLMGETRGRKVMLIMTDGLDNKSSTPFREMVETAVRSEASVYVVSKIAVAREANKRLKTISEPEFLKADIDLRTLAYETGGRVLQMRTIGELEDIYAQVDQELRNQYILGFISTNEAKDGSYRKLKVEVDYPEAIISSRPGYYAPGPHSHASKN